MLTYHVHTLATGAGIRAELRYRRRLLAYATSAQAAQQLQRIWLRMVQEREQ